MTVSELSVSVVDGILFVVVNRPAKRNALSRSLLRDLQDVFTTHRSTSQLVAAVVRGAGDKSFAAGGDLVDLGSVRTETEATAMATEARNALDAIRTFPVPVIAAVNGDALGGGAELAVSCDFRVAAAHARIGFIQGRLAIPTAWGGGPDLVSLVGPKKALLLLSTSAIADPQVALDLGLYDAVASVESDFDQTVEAFLEPIRLQSPQVARAFKAVTSAAGNDRQLGRAVETEHFARCWVHEDHWLAHERALNKATRSPTPAQNGQR